MCVPPVSKVERSKHRDEIDDLLLDGKAAGFVSNYLKDEYNESISESSIRRYKNSKLNVKTEAIVMYNEEQSQKKKDNAVSEYVEDINKIDNLIEDASNIDFNDMTNYQKGRILIGLFGEKAKLLGHSDTEVNIVNEIESKNIVSLDDDELEDLLKINDEDDNFVDQL